MSDMINLLNTNKEWLFSGIGVVILGLIIRSIFHRLHKKNNVKSKQTQNTGDNCTNFQSGGNLTINNPDFGGKKNVK
jgi:hypothetical protein